MSDLPDPLRLPNRDGLPSEIAFLRDAYPQRDWPSHANYGELSAFWIHVHDSLRSQGRMLQSQTGAFRAGDWQAGSFQRQFMPQLGHYLQHLEGHHHIEDAHYFPRFRRLDKRMIVGFDLLENDHDIIHQRVLAVADTARALMQALERGDDAARYAADHHADAADRLLVLLDRHLDDEEDLVIPAILEHRERPLR